MFISWTRISTSFLPVLAMRKELSICNHCKRTPTNSTSWFSSVPIGKNTPFEKLKNVSSDAGIDGNKVNHGLHTTSTTEMVQAHVPEKSNQESTGHRSLAALRTYERSTEEQHRAMSTILSSSSQRSYEQTIQR